MVCFNNSWEIQSPPSPGSAESSCVCLGVSPLPVRRSLLTPTRNNSHGKRGTYLSRKKPMLVGDLTSVKREGVGEKPDFGSMQSSRPTSVVDPTPFCFANCLPDISPLRLTKKAGFSLSLDDCSMSASSSYSLKPQDTFQPMSTALPSTDSSSTSCLLSIGTMSRTERIAIAKVLKRRNGVIRKCDRPIFNSSLVLTSLSMDAERSVINEREVVGYSKMAVPTVAGDISDQQTMRARSNSHPKLDISKIISPRRIMIGRDLQYDFNYASETEAERAQIPENRLHGCRAPPQGSITTDSATGTDPFTPFDETSSINTDAGGSILPAPIATSSPMHVPMSHRSRAQLRASKVIALQKAFEHSVFVEESLPPSMSEEEEEGRVVYRKRTAL